MEERDKHLQMLAAAEQLRQQMIAQINDIALEQQQMDMRRQQLLQETLKMEGRIETLQDLTREKEEVQDGKTIPFPKQEREAPGGQEGEGGSDGHSKD